MKNAKKEMVKWRRTQYIILLPADYVGISSNAKAKKDDEFSYDMLQSLLV